MTPQNLSGSEFRNKDHDRCENDNLRGYGGGLAHKKWLIDHERQGK